MGRTLAILALLGASPAWAGDLRLGWQLGLNQTIQGTVSSNNPAFDVTGSSTAAGTRAFVQGGQGGLVFTTLLSANGSLDYLTGSWDQGLVGGIALTQTAPTLQPAGGGQPSATGFVFNASYLLRHVRPLWAWELGANYAFGVNGQLAVAPNGGTTTGASTLAGQPVGRFTVNNQSHTLGARTDLFFNRPRWDGQVGARYDLLVNGVNTLVNAAVVGNGTSLSAFVPATTHTLAATAQGRRRVGQLNTLVANGGIRWTTPVAAEVEEGFAQNLVPETLAIDGGVSFERRFRGEDRMFLGVNGTLSYRVPTSLNAGTTARVQGLPLLNPDTGEPYGSLIDSLIYRGEVGVDGRLLKLDIRYRVSAGVAQARLYQPALGTAQAAFAVYDEAAVGDFEPIFSVGLDRRFDPVDINLLVARVVQAGGLGASAVVNDSASLSSSIMIEATRTTAVRIVAGVSASRISSAGGDAVPEPPRRRRDRFNDTLATLITNSASLSTSIGVDAPLFRQDGFSIDANASYSFAYTDPTIGLDVVPGAGTTLQIGSSHGLLVAFRGQWGQGPLDSTNNDIENENLAAYATNPRDGSALISARLLNLRGAGQSEQRSAPGMPSGTSTKASRKTNKSDDERGVRGTASASADSVIKGDEPSGYKKPPVQPPAPPKMPDAMAPYDESQLIRPIQPARSSTVAEPLDQR